MSTEIGVTLYLLSSPERWQEEGLGCENGVSEEPASPQSAHSLPGRGPALSLRAPGREGRAGRGSRSLLSSTNGDGDDGRRYGQGSVERVATWTGLTHARSHGQLSQKRSPDAFRGQRDVSRIQNKSPAAGTKAALGQLLAPLRRLCLKRTGSYQNRVPLYLPIS